ncbi:hypothetical protein ACSBR2_025269 [Camellia fascicularis]
MSWNETTIDYCSWDGIKCDRMTGQVIALDLSCSRLYGTILPNNSLFSLRHLQRLNLAFNDFTQSGISPSFGQLSSLTHLNLSSSFSGSIPSKISHLSKLVSLDLFSYYHFSGQVSSIFSNPEQLFYLDISYNRLEGQIPNIANLSKVAYFTLRRNHFIGQFPCWVANLTQLVCLNIGLNELTSPIPANLRGFSNLRYLCSAFNSHTGTLPIWLYNLPSLKYLSLASNEFTGQIYEFQSKSLNHINLRCNKLQGPIPPFPTIINLFLSKNTFTGEIPSTICNVSFLEILDFSHNSLSGVIPQCLANFSNVLSVLDLRMNNFHGNIPSTFTEGKKLRNIDLNGNQLKGRVPRSLATYRHLEVLDVGNNKINDTFPYWLEFLLELQVLVFKSNKFHGPGDSSVNSSPHGVVGGWRLSLLVKKREVGSWRFGSH